MKLSAGEVTQESFERSSGSSLIRHLRVSSKLALVGLGDYKETLFACVK
jgi:hypothetical protein